MAVSLRKLYRRFLDFSRKDFIRNAKAYSTTLKGLHLKEELLNRVYENYERPPYLTFLRNVKSILYGDSIFSLIKENYLEDWDLYRYLKILHQEDAIEIDKNGKAHLKEKSLINLIPPRYNLAQIRQRLENTLRTKIQPHQPITALFTKHCRFCTKIKWDQMPISQESALFVAEKILEKLPLWGNFLFIGDDDFISAVLALTDRRFQATVLDIDEELLSAIRTIADKFGLSITTLRIDLKKNNPLQQNFVGFLANPIYTEAGIKEFVHFGTNQLSSDGGVVFLEIGDEAIGNRFVFLQEYLNKRNLIIREVIPNKIYYPQLNLYEEDKEILKRLNQFVSKDAILRSPKIGAALYVCDYLPQRPKRVNFKGPIYAYL